MEKVHVILFALLLLSVINLSAGANILFYFGISSYSHRIVVWPLVEELAARGHQVTFLSPYFPKKPSSNPNVTEFSPKSLQDFIRVTLGADSNMIETRLAGAHIQVWDAIQEFGIGMCEVLMKDPEYLKMVQNQKFDLVIIDALFNDCAMGVVHVQNTRYVIFDTTHVFMWQYDMFGFPDEASWSSDLALGLPYPMSFAQKIYNTMRPLLWHFSRIYYLYPRLEAIMNEGFKLTPEKAIHLADMELNCSLILINSHFSVDSARSLPPLFVPVGGLHIQAKSQGLPKDLKDFIDKSEDGFIYISFGSLAQISKANRDIQRALYYAIGNTTNSRFLWKWEGDSVPEDMPPNVITAKWMPQNDILAHPKIKAFITHGGLLGIEEALTSGVPLIAFPVFAEQDYNSERLHRLGYGIRLEFMGLKQEHLQDAIHKVLTNPGYKEKMMEISKLFNDRQVAPLETAVWWTEYVLRNKNTEYLIPLGRHQSWFSRRLLDVWGTIIGSVFLLLGILIGYCARNSNRSNARSQFVLGNKKTK